MKKRNKAMPLRYKKQKRSSILNDKVKFNSSFISNTLSLLTLIFAVVIFVGYTRQQDKDNKKFNKISQNISNQQKQIAINSAPFTLDPNKGIEFVRDSKSKSTSRFVDSRTLDSVNNETIKNRTINRNVDLQHTYLKINPSSGVIIRAKWFLLLPSNFGRGHLGTFGGKDISVTTENIDKTDRDISVTAKNIDKTPAIVKEDSTEEYSGNWYFNSLGDTSNFNLTYYFLLITAGDGKNYLYAVIMNGNINKEPSAKNWFPTDGEKKDNVPDVEFYDYSTFLDSDDAMGEEGQNFSFVQFCKIYKAFKEDLVKELTEVR
ncbi:hypothetical protein [Pseudolactococcus carnosus]|uniref:hypothetical protein n=1 Tax=Pseudolactococcus carnosus TaxID=2749961 RepID=UPI001FB9E046|nr:hypothetical protein [Lactococcus carnosus]MCJ2003314.1 hypothetical protein [Lactococcus carnosus]